MIAIGDVLISDEILNEEFVCNLSACKGACCWEGDYGAPVSKIEQEAISRALPEIWKYLPETSRQLISEQTPFVEYTEPGFTGTNLHKDGSCVFMSKNKDGTAVCGIEKSHEDGNIENLKPLSCHLYPIRVISNPTVGFEAWNYDRWSICSAACSNGKNLKVKIYKFLKTAIVRAKGSDFYEELHAAAEHLQKDK